MFLLRILIYITIGLLPFSALADGVEGGTISIQNWPDDGPVKLSGTWVYKEGILTPENWFAAQEGPIETRFTPAKEQGTSLSRTYVLTLQNLSPGMDLGISYRTSGFTRIYFGPSGGPLSPIKQSGEQTNGNLTRAESGNFFASLPIAENGVYQLLIQNISPKEGSFSTPSLVSADRFYSKSKQNNQPSGNYFDAIYFGLAMGFGIFFLYLYTQRFDDSSYLWLGISAICFATFPVELTSSYWSTIKPSFGSHATSLELRIAFLGTPLALLAFANFSAAFYQIVQFQLLRLGVSGLMLILLGVGAFLPLPMLSSLMVASLGVSMLAIALIVVFQTLITRSRISHGTFATLIILGLIVTAIFLLRDSFPNQPLDTEYQYLARALIILSGASLSIRELFLRATQTRRAAREIRKEFQNKLRELSAIFENIPYGVLSIYSQGIVGPNYSPTMPDMLKTDDINGKNISNLIFSRKQFDKDQISNFESIIINSIGEEHEDLDEVLKPLPTRMTVSSGRDTNEIECSWVPISHDKRTLNKITLLIKEVDQKISDRANPQPERAAPPPEPKSPTVIQARNQKTKVKEPLAETVISTPEHKKEMEESQETTVMPQQPPPPSPPEEVQAPLPPKIDRDKNFGVIKKVRTELATIDASPLQPEDQTKFRSSLDACTEVIWDDLENYMNELVTLLTISGSAKFPKFPDLIFDVEQKYSISDEAKSLLKENLETIFSQIVTHSIEATEERLSLEKPEKGRIHIKAKHDGYFLNIFVQDDGRGLDLSLLKSKFSETPSDSQNLADRLLLEPVDFGGEDNPILNEVRQNIELLGGHLYIQVPPGADLEGCVPFRMIIQLPFSHHHTFGIQAS